MWRAKVGLAQRAAALRTPANPPSDVCTVNLDEVVALQQTRIDVAHCRSGCLLLGATAICASACCVQPSGKTASVRRGGLTVVFIVDFRVSKVQSIGQSIGHFGRRIFLYGSVFRSSVTAPGAPT